MSSYPTLPLAFPVPILPRYGPWWRAWRCDQSRTVDLETALRTVWPLSSASDRSGYRKWDCISLGGECHGGNSLGEGIHHRAHLVPTQNRGEKAYDVSNTYKLFLFRIVRKLRLKNPQMHTRSSTFSARRSIHPTTPFTTLGYWSARLRRKSVSSSDCLACTATVPSMPYSRRCCSSSGGKKSRRSDFMSSFSQAKGYP